MYIWLHNNLPWYDMDFIFVYVIKHKWLNLSQFFEHICMSLNRDTDNLHFHQSRDHEDSSWFEIANSSWSREFLMIVGRNHCRSKRVSLIKSQPIIMFKGRGNNQARSITQKMEPLNNVNKILSVMYTKGGMETYSGNESTQAA